MISINEVREKYPDYNDLSDQQLADALHTKYYSDIPKDEFYSKIGLNNNSSIEPISSQTKAHHDIKQKYPAAPDWYINAITSMVGDKDHPLLKKLGEIAEPIGKGAKMAGVALLPGSIAIKGLKAFSKFHPLTKGQMGRQFEEPLNAAEQAEVRHELPNNQLFELNDLLSHPALEARGAAGRSLTAQGRQAAIQGAAEGRPSALHSSQSLLGDLERVLPGLGESELVSQRVRPMKDFILNHLKEGMENKGIIEESENYTKAREAARRYFKTNKNIKKLAKITGVPTTLAAIVKLLGK